MLRTSLVFLAVALGCLLFADLEVSNFEPWFEIRRILVGAVTPDFSVLAEYSQALLNTVVIAFCSIFLGIMAGLPAAFFFEYRAVRLVCAFIRGIHELFWAFLLLPIVGLNPTCAILAIAIPYAGIFAKVYAELLQESDHTALKGFPAKTPKIMSFFFGILPLIFEDVRHYTSYRFECALRSSAILGFVGLPTLGYHLETAFREGAYSQSAALLYVFYFLIISLKFWLKRKWVLAYVGLSFVLVSKQVSFSLANTRQFLCYEILPWPMRRDGFLDQSGSVKLALGGVWEWFKKIWTEEVWQGLFSTVILTQIALVLTAFLALIGFSLVCQHLHRPRFRRLAHYALIVLRTTPEFILAYLFVQMAGPSMLPAIGAICLHNAAILAYLTGKNADLVTVLSDAPKKGILLYFFELLPRVYGQFLAFLFYRWEVMMRESAILGLLGVYSLGFFIDSAIVDDKMDKALLLIVITAFLNMGVDSISQRVRKHLKISNRLISKTAQA